MLCDIIVFVYEITYTVLYIHALTVCYILFNCLFIYRIRICLELNCCEFFVLLTLFVNLIHRSPPCLVVLHYLCADADTHNGGRLWSERLTL